MALISRRKLFPNAPPPPLPPVIQQRESGPPSLWMDLTGLAQHPGNVTGIQRTISGVAQALLDKPPSAMPVRFCEFKKKQGFFEIEPAEARSILAWLGRARLPVARTPMERAKRRLRKRVYGEDPLVAPFGATDVLLNLGYANYIPHHRPTVAHVLAETGVRYVGFIYDVLVLRHPEWWSPATQALTRNWFLFTAQRSAMVLCCSEATRRDASWFFEREAIADPPALATVRLAGDFAAMRAVGEGDAPVRPRPYVLYVSTIDVRKNHRLLFQVWKRLIAAHGADAVPDLVCVGRKGALTRDFLHELDYARHLGGRIVLDHDVSDDELARLYAGCLFTVFPSLAEGWGLPVTESLAHGKYCVASDAASLREVGGDLVDYHDPFDLDAATELIARAAFDADFRARKESAIRAGFREGGWPECVEAIARTVEPLSRPAAPRVATAEAAR